MFVPLHRVSIDFVTLVSRWVSGFHDPCIMLNVYTRVNFFTDAPPHGGRLTNIDSGKYPVYCVAGTSEEKAESRPGM